MSTTTIAVESYGRTDDLAGRPGTSPLRRLVRVLGFFKRLSSLGSSIVAVIGALAGGVVSIAGVFQIDPGITNSLSEYFHGSGAEWSESADVQVLTNDGSVPRLTVKSCHTGRDPRETKHLAYVLIEGRGGLSNIEPFVMLRDKCNAPDTLWMNTADYDQLMKSVDRGESVTSVIFTRVDLDKLDELLGKAGKLDKGEA